MPHRTRSILFSGVLLLTCILYFAVMTNCFGQEFLSCRQVSRGALLQAVIGPASFRRAELPFQFTTLDADQYRACDSQSAPASAINERRSRVDLANVWHQLVGDDAAAYLGISAKVVVRPSSIANAFASPSGEVVLTSQLLKQLRDPGELAFVIAHEIGHLKLGHGAQEGSFKAEREADKMAVDLIARAGFDPCSGSRALLKLGGAHSSSLPTLAPRIKALVNQRCF